MHLHEEYLARHSLSALPLIKHTKNLYFAYRGPVGERFVDGILFANRFIHGVEPPAYSFNILTGKADCKNSLFKTYDLGIVEWDAYELFIHRWVTESDPIVPDDLDNFYWRMLVWCHQSTLRRQFGGDQPLLQLWENRSSIEPKLIGRPKRHWKNILTKYRDNNADWLVDYVKVWKNQALPSLKVPPRSRLICP